MVTFLDSHSDVQRFAQVLAEYERRLQALKRTAQAGHSSIQGGALEVYDDPGTLRGTVGVQIDGTVSVAPTNAAPRPPRY